jgi:hypothetical protein
MTKVMPCWYCGSVVPGPRYREHKIPKQRGGGEGRNLVPACPSCNLVKGSMTIEEWRAQLAMNCSRSVKRGFYGEIYTMPKEPKRYWERPAQLEFDCACGARIVVPGRESWASLYRAGWDTPPASRTYDERLLLQTPAHWQCGGCKDFERRKAGWSRRAWPAIDVDPCGC